MNFMLQIWTKSYKNKIGKNAANPHKQRKIPQSKRLRDFNFLVREAGLEPANRAVKPFIHAGFRSPSVSRL